VRAKLPWIVIAPEMAPSGADETVTLGGRYGETGLDDSRFE
jgi:hypothetical protein